MSYSTRLHEVQDETVVVGRLRLDLGSLQATVDGVELGLTLQELEMLLKLASEQHRLVRRDELTLAFWGGCGRVQRKRLSVVISQLRRKLAAADAYQIETVRKLGYRLVAQYQA